MKKTLYLLWLSIFWLSLSAQTSSDSAQRYLAVSVNFGSSQDYMTSAPEVDGYKARSRPLTTETFNHYSVSLNLNSVHHPSLTYSLSAGYQSIRPGYGIASYNSWNGRFWRGTTIPSVFIQPSVKWQVELNDRWSFLPGAGMGLHHAFSPKNEVSFIKHHIINPLYVTVHSSVEFRMWLTHNFYGSVQATYQHGLMPMFRSELLFGEEEDNELAQYNGNNLLIAFKLSYCIPCRE